MDRGGFDLLLLSQRENVEYVSGYISSHWFMQGFVPGVVLFPRYGEPCLVVPGFWLGTAEKKSWFEDIIVHTDTHSAPDTFPALVSDAIDQRGWDSGKIGYEAGAEMTVGLPIHHFDQIRRGLASATWSACGPLLWEVRMVKSVREIDLLRAAAVGTSRALARVRNDARVGMTELEIGQMIRRYQVEEGCHDRQFLNVRCGPERYSMTDTLPEDRPIRNGEMLIMDVGMHRDGYWSDTARCAAVGQPSSLYLDVYETIREALAAALATVRPGAPAAAPYHAARAVMDQAGFDVHIDMMGHGIGMSMYEPPMLSPIIEGQLLEGMVLCIEPWITLPENRGVLCLEEIVLVTAAGFKLLTVPNARELWVIE
jgi:Xaa-Pro aminopeptidase